MGPSWLPHDPGSRPQESLGCFTLAEVVDLLGKLSDGWQKGLGLYQKSLAPVVGTENSDREIASAVIAGCSFRSTYNIYRWYKLRKRKIKVTPGKAEHEIIADEIENLTNALPHLENNRQFGYHEETKWQIYSESDIKNKIHDLELMIA